MGSHRPRLLLRFGLISALAIAALGVVLIAELRSTIRGQAVDEGRTLAALATRLKVMPLLEPADLEGAPNPFRQARMHDVLDAELRAADVVRIKIWNRDGRIVYSDARDLQGKREPVNAN